MILIAGGTGTLGRQLVSRLTTSGRPVRVLTRDAAHALDLPVDVAIGDVRDTTTLRAAVDGCSTVVSAVHGFLGGRGAGPGAIDAAGNANLIRAAAAADAHHFVLLSVLGARADHPLELHRAKHAAEQDLVAGELSWTIVRPSSYIETWIGVMGAQSDSGGGAALVFGRGSNPINFVSVRDVAMLVERAIDQPELRNKSIDVAGPDNLTMVDVARQLGATRIRHVPRVALRLLTATARPFAPALARQAATALFMDTTDMTADAADLIRDFPDLDWHHVRDITTTDERRR